MKQVLQVNDQLLDKPVLGEDILALHKSYEDMELVDKLEAPLQNTHKRKLVTGRIKNESELAEFAENLKQHKLNLNGKNLTLKLGLGFEGYDTKRKLIANMLELESQNDFKLYIEISRASLTQDLPTLMQLLHEFKDLRLIMDLAELLLSHEALPFGMPRFQWFLKKIRKNLKGLRCNIATCEHDVLISDDFKLPLIPRGALDIHLRLARWHLRREWQQMLKHCELDFLIFELKEIKSPNAERVTDLLEEYRKQIELSRSWLKLA